MADIDTTKTLILVGWILQINISVIFLALGGLLIFAVIQSLALWGYFYWSLPFVVILYEFAMAIVGIVFVPFWRRWGEDPFEYKQNLIATGAIAMCGGVIGGLLVLVGAAILSESDMAPVTPQPTFTPAPAPTPAPATPAPAPEPAPEPEPEPEAVLEEPEPWEESEVAEPEAEPAAALACPNCGKALEADAKFCTSCGNQL